MSTGRSFDPYSHVTRRKAINGGAPPTPGAGGALFLPQTHFSLTLKSGGTTKTLVFSPGCYLLLVTDTEEDYYETWTRPYHFGIQ